MDSVHPGSPERPATEHLPVLPDGLDVIRLLGEGKMARVYLARERALERAVAVKVLRPERSRDETDRLRFEREARSAASLSHPNVVSVYRFGQLPDGTPYLVMSYVQGRTLADRLQADGPLSEREGRDLLMQLASALASAHKKGIVHRDVRPGNVLIDDESGRVLLSDFGIAGLLEAGTDRGPRLTQTGQMIGEPRYSSPEQLRGDKVTGQADIYSLGVLAYEALTGEGPYRAASAREVFAAHLTGKPRPINEIRPGISADLEDLLLRCLAREPAHRPRAEDVLKRLEGQAAHPNPTAVPRVAPAPEGLMLAKRRWPQIVSSATVVGGSLLGLVLAAMQVEMLPRAAGWLTANLVGWGIAVSGVVAWFHGEKGPQKPTLVEIVLVAALVLGWLGTTVFLLMR
jgi:eukaryotic-like serine/threonine-protein kinase